MTREEKRLAELEEEIIRFNMVNRPINHSELGLKQWGEMVAHHFAEWQYQKDRGEFAQIKAKTWCEGFDACKEQMMKNAVDAIVENWNPGPEPEITIPLNPEEFTCGDKVRIIILPKED